MTKEEILQGRKRGTRMTREEARKTINEILGCFGNKAADGEYELTKLDAEDMREAIERVSVVECEDAISRADAIGLFKDDVAAVNELMQLESVHPKVCECEDTISRQAALDAIDTWDKFGVDDTNSLFRLDNLSLPNYAPYIHYDDVIKCIKGMPSVTPKQKMGRWELVYRDGGVEHYLCNKCRKGRAMVDDDFYRKLMDFKYCPNCGAKMEEDLI